ncbi:MAG: MBL fold metallo-hydrolase [Gammaproteobacteria bacterium]|nr:MBL fold metallo-hydrolase [Gammaproteobacteria bacterium]
MISRYQDLGWGVSCIEAGFQRPGLAGCYLLLRDGEAALIDTGTARTFPNILSLFAEKGIDRSQLRYVIPTHVHLDHAGGAGQLMAHFPRASLVVHPNGARHLIAPEKLAAGSRAVYGEADFQRHFLELLPVDEARVITAQDGLELELGNSRLTCIDAPGHARHHIVIHDPASGGLFTGDTFGIAYPELTTKAGPYLLLPSTPVQFDPEGWHRTLDRLLAIAAKRVFLTHYSGIDQAPQHAESLHQQIDAYVDIARGAAGQQERYPHLHQALWEFHDARLDRHGCRLDQSQRRLLLEMDIGLCAQGLDVWLQRQAG